MYSSTAGINHPDNIFNTNRCTNDRAYIVEIWIYQVLSGYIIVWKYT